ncbi:MAG: hypothetical protein U9P44_04265 [archaeon]|nr:hypothetical protein [archaeon]
MDGKIISKLKALFENEEALSNIVKLLSSHNLESDIEFDDHEIVVDGVSFRLNGKINVKTRHKAE